eukprot:jgi/Galph1/5299/GphlegSOOS_G3959.1
MKLRLLSCLLICLFIVTSHGFNDDPETLPYQQEMLLQQISNTEKEIKEYSRQIQLLKEEESKLDTEYKKLEQAKNWELRKMQEKEKQVEELKQTTEQKQQLVDTYMERIEENKKEIERLETDLNALSEERDFVAHRYYSPSLTQVLDEISASWDPLPRDIYVKTKTKILPLMLDYKERANLYKQKISLELENTSKWSHLLVSFVVYSSLMVSAILLFAIIRKIRNRLSIHKLLLLSDMAYAFFWLIIIVTCCIFWTNAFTVLRQNNETFFLLLQMILFLSYTGVMALRLFVFAIHLSWQSLLELFLLLIACQHYYFHIWQPAMTDRILTATLWSYVLYFMTFQVLVGWKLFMFGLVPKISNFQLRPMVTYWNLGRNRLVLNSMTENDIAKYA